MLKIDYLTFYRNGQKINESCERINLVIGGNNSGKTTFLNDIYRELKILHAHPPDVFWTFGHKLTFEAKEPELKEMFPNLLDREDNFINFDQINKNVFVLTGKEEIINWSRATQDLLRKSKNPKYEVITTYGYYERDSEIQDLFRFLTQIFVKIENCINRLDAKFHTKIDDLSQNDANDFIFHLYKNRDILKRIQNNIKDVYNLEIDFDNLPQGFKPLRIIHSKVKKSITDPFELYREWNNKTTLLSGLSQGIRAYLQLIFTILHPSNRIILIDEPEIFIHPPQRRTLGKLVAQLALEENKQLFICTHDAEFMRGILSSSKEVKIFRLFNQNRNYFFETITSESILSLIDKKAANILNERILNSLFYKKTILCENENDRVFYEEVAAKYNWKNFHDINFIGFTGKDTAIKVYNRLLELKIKPALILDLDYLVSGPFPAIENEQLKQKHKNLQEAFSKLSFNKTSVDYGEFKKIGLKLFNRKKYSNLKKQVNQTINEFKNYQIFIVPAGELESWTGSEKNDLTDALQKIRNKTISPLKTFINEVMTVD